MWKTKSSLWLRAHIKLQAHLRRLVSSQTEFFVLKRSVVTTPAASGVIPKVSWASALKASFLCTLCVMQL
jgi:hypothetical protein